MWWARRNGAVRPTQSRRRSVVVRRCWTVAVTAPSAVRRTGSSEAKISTAGSSRQTGSSPGATSSMNERRVWMKR